MYVATINAASFRKEISQTADTSTVILIKFTWWNSKKKKKKKKKKTTDADPYYSGRESWTNCVDLGHTPRMFYGKLQKIIPELSPNIPP